MITVKLSGGLGNQLYQIAAAYSAARANYDTFYIDYKLPHTAMQGKHPSVYKDTMFRKFKNEHRKVNLLYTEPYFRFKEIPYFVNFNYAIEGYFQSYKYFAGYLKDLRKLITFQDDLTTKVHTSLNQLKDRFKCDKIVGVHVRHGDYTYNPDIFPIPSPAEYYKKCISKFDEDKTLFLYATDDPQYLFKNFKLGNKHIYVNGKDELYDLCVLSNCDSLIIANSSFSAWSSYLVKQKEIVCCPKIWFGDSIDATDLFDPSWTKVV